MKKQVLFCFLALAAVSCFAQTDAKTNFQQKCALCHGPDAKATVPMARKMGAVDLTSQAVQSQSDTQLRDAIMNGKGKMPPYGGVLGKKGVADMVKFVRSLAPSKNTAGAPKKTAR